MSEPTSEQVIAELRRNSGERRSGLLLPQPEHLPARSGGVHSIEQMARAEAKRARKRRRRQKHMRHQPR